MYEYSYFVLLFRNAYVCFLNYFVLLISFLLFIVFLLIVLNYVTYCFDVIGRCTVALFVLNSTFIVTYTDNGSVNECMNIYVCVCV
jgi:hypothetical protein